MATQVRAASVPREDFQELREMVAQLAAAQVRSEERWVRIEALLEQLLTAQTRQEEQIRELAAGQARQEERLARIEAGWEELAAAQARQEERISRLEVLTEEHGRELSEIRTILGETNRKVDILAKQVGALSHRLGGDLEDVAYTVIYAVLKRELGWEVGPLARVWVNWGKGKEEVNVFGQAQDPARPEQTIWIMGEAKFNPTLREVKRFKAKLERARKHLVGEIFPVIFCYRMRPEVRRAVEEAGIRIVFSFGQLV